MGSLSQKRHISSANCSTRGEGVLEWRTVENKLSYDIVAINKTDRFVPPTRITRNTHSGSYQIASTSSDYRKGCFSPSTFRERNAISLDIVEAKTPEAFERSDVQD